MEKTLEKDIGYYIREEMHDCIGTNGKVKNIPTCKITEENIYNITHFLAHKIPKCEHLDINLENIRNGKIIGKGSFGYSFLVTKNTNEKVIIKIVVCNKTDGQTEEEFKTERQIIKEEIDIHAKLSKLDSKYNKYIAKIFGYISKDDIKSMFSTKSTYTYHDIISDKIECIFPSKHYVKNCELYLFMEAGESDLTHFKISNITDVFDDLTNAIFDLLDFYQISKSFVENNNKIFIHSDIKPDNIVIFRSESDNKIILKLIDFGVSIFSNTFNDDNSYGTPYMYKFLFTYESDEKYKKQITFRSPLFDIFSIIISYLQIIFMYYRIKLDFMNKTYRFSYLQTIINDNINELTHNLDVKNKVKRIMKLGKIIYDFHQKNIREYVINHDTLEFEENIELYEKNIDIENIKKSSSETNFPEYNKDESKSKLYNDYNYLDNIMKYVLHENLGESSA